METGGKCHNTIHSGASENVANGLRFFTLMRRIEPVKLRVANRSILRASHTSRIEVRLEHVDFKMENL